ncbi:cell division protein FtsQ/DivIB [Primorskyibacter sp. S187A]|uniref:cell division protein FtsQ/DivIB n=1 Tax=Primorskyibacter sp. S187A TaxID=3415130 RepID=UPI003C7E3E34
MPKIMRTAYHPAHGGPVPNAPSDQPSFASAPKRADPAPSRWAYRMQRLMLTPLFRLALRVGVPMAVAFAVTGGYLADETRRDHVVQVFVDMRAAIEERPEFMVKLMKIDGASAEVAQDIHEILPVDFPISSFDLDLDHMRETIAGLDPVERVSLRIQPGGTLRVQITERLPAVVWRSGQGIEVLDAQGFRVGPLVRRTERPDLPLIVGDGADDAVGEALQIINAAGPLLGKIRGLMRMGERRWDVVLDEDKRIMLPVDGPVRALERVIAMDAAMDLLDRDIASVDLRLRHRPTLRMKENAVEELRRIKAVEFGFGAAEQ